MRQNRGSSGGSAFCVRHPGETAGNRGGTAASRSAPGRGRMGSSGAGRREENASATTGTSLHFALICFKNPSPEQDSPNPALRWEASVSGNTKCSRDKCKTGAASPASCPPAHGHAPSALQRFLDISFSHAPYLGHRSESCRCGTRLSLKVFAAEPLPDFTAHSGRGQRDPPARPHPLPALRAPYFGHLQT